MSDDPARRYRHLSRVRGLMLGLALGDALAGSRAGDRLLGTTTSQLAAFTAEGIIRAAVRMDHKGICHPPSIVWFAYRRWAHLQGIDLGREPHPLTGWLHQVPALRRRRGSAPAVVEALVRSHQVPSSAPAQAAGHHALTRVLPLAAATGLTSAAVREIVSCTHGDPEAVAVAVAAVDLVRTLLDVDDPSAVLAGVHAPAALDEAAPDHRATSAWRGGVALARTCTSPGDVEATLRRAAEARVPAAVGPVLGALLGAVHGVEALPVAAVSELELGWVVDTLARDLVSQFTDRPGGGEWEPEPDPHWWSRYPGG